LVKDWNLQVDRWYATTVGKGGYGCFGV